MNNIRSSKNGNVNVWLVKGYKSFFDQKEEAENFSIEVAMDAMFSKRDVENIFISRFKKYRCVKLNAELVRSFEVEKGLSEQNFFAYTE